jgi:predicted RNA-binding Zn-ribbon protein involved in translation (DUF1610 family)
MVDESDHDIKVFRCLSCGQRIYPDYPKRSGVFVCSRCGSEMDEKNELSLCKNCLRLVNIHAEGLKRRDYGEAVCICGTKFTRKRPNQLYHSKNCKHQAMTAQRGGKREASRPRKVITPREIVEAYFFWKWEYERRNPEYIDAYDKFEKLVEKIINTSQLPYQHVVLTETKQQGKVVLGHRIEEGALLGLPKDLKYMIQMLEPWAPQYLRKMIQDEDVQKTIGDFHETYGRFPKDPKYGYSGKHIVDFLVMDRKKPIPQRSKYPAEDIRGHESPITELDRKRAIEDFFKEYGEHPEAPKPGCSGKEIAEFLCKYVLKHRKKSSIQQPERSSEDINRQDESDSRASGFFSAYMGEYAQRTRPVGVKIANWDESQKRLLLGIDVTKPLSVILEGVSTCYLRHSVDIGSKPADLLPLIEHNFGIIKNFLNEKELRQFRAWEPRAAGLLLWGYMEENKGSSVEDALEVPEIVKYLEDLGYDKPIKAARTAKFAKPGYVAEQKKEDYYRQFRRYRQKTDDCITQRKVLPIK